MLFTVKDNNKLNSPLGLNKEFWLWINNELNINYKIIFDYLLKKEIEIINKFPPKSDGGTNLPNYITSRYSFYNLFSFKDCPEEIEMLKKFIKINVKNLLLDFKIKNTEDLHILCWFNVLREGEAIGKHSHYNLKNAHESFISGHFCINAFNTHTYYENISNTNGIGIKNEIGQLTLFPSYITHFSDKHVGKDVRISIAFDIYYTKEYPSKGFLHKGIVIPFDILNY